MPHPVRSTNGYHEQEDRTVLVDIARAQYETALGKLVIDHVSESVDTSPQTNSWYDYSKNW